VADDDAVAATRIVQLVGGVGSTVPCGVSAASRDWRVVCRALWRGLQAVQCKVECGEEFTLPANVRDFLLDHWTTQCSSPRSFVRPGGCSRRS
jgi:hypothetical protein